MAFGILEDRYMDVVPGTACMNDQSDIPREYERIPRELLKHGKGRQSHIILVPQPSDSPNDPLNWPLWKKDTILLIVGLFAAVVGAFGPMLSPGFVQIAGELGVSVNTFSQSTAWLVLTLGISLFITNPIAKVWGRRPVFIASSIIMFACSIWGAFAKSYSSFLASRIVSGFGMAPFEVLVQCTIGDMYYVHQRGTRIAAWILFLLSGISGGSLISGYIIQNIGWQWTFGICAIIFGVLFCLVFLYIPETAYNRVPIEERTQPGVDLDQNHIIPIEPSEKRDTYLRSLRIYNGRFSDEAFWRLLLRPFVVFWYPAVLWAFLIYGTTLSWIVVFSVVNAAIFTLPPYNFTVDQVGLISISPFVLSLIGEALAGPLNDYICLVLTKRNHGIYEPEFRLALMVLVLLLGITGFFGFGAAVHYQTHWIGPVLTFGIANMAMAFAAPCVYGYVIDSHETLREEALVAINARNFLTFGLTYFVNDWLEKDGVLAVFNVLGSCFIGVCVLTVPLWIFGKRARGVIARNQMLNKVMSN